MYPLLWWTSASCQPWLTIHVVIETYRVMGRYCWIKPSFDVVPTHSILDQTSFMRFLGFSSLNKFSSLLNNIFPKTVLFVNNVKRLLETKHLKNGGVQLCHARAVGLTTFSVKSIHRILSWSFPKDNCPKYTDSFLLCFNGKHSIMSFLSKLTRNNF